MQLILNQWVNKLFSICKVFKYYYLSTANIFEKQTGSFLLSLSLCHTSFQFLSLIDLLIMYLPLPSSLSFTLKQFTYYNLQADLGGPAVLAVGLRSLDFWDRRFECRSGHWCRLLY
jgi:hypothetical protein